MVNLNFEYVDLTTLVEIDSGSDIEVKSRTWAEVIQQVKSTNEQLRHDTGALTMDTAWHKFHIYVSDVWNNTVQNQPISGLFGVSTNGLYAYSTTGNWAGIVLQAENSNGNRWRIVPRVRKDLLDENGTPSSWFNEGVDKWITVAIQDIGGKPRVYWRIFDDPDFTEPPSEWGTFTSVQAGVSPFRYAAVCASVAQITSYYATYNYYSYLEVFPPVSPPGVFPIHGARLWVSKWRVPGKIAEGANGALLCIDPHGLRTDDNKGPVIYVLDKLNFSPGITEKSGVMRAEINDNATEDTHAAGRVDMELLKEDTIWIRDDDEFWVGIQRGPDAGGLEPHGAWDPYGGSDGLGAGRKWLMGGYISKRYYNYDENGRITAVMIGKDFMDVWKDQIFGTPSIPRIYTEDTDLSRIAKDIIDDINSFQPEGWRYSQHPTYFPSTAELTLNCNYLATACVVADNSAFTIGPAYIWDDISNGEVVIITGFTGATQIDFIGDPIQQLLGYQVANNAKIAQSIGTEWKKEFNQEPSDTVMIDICDASAYEWRIDYMKRVMLYSRILAPVAPTIRFTTNIRQLPEIVMGDTTERITHVIVTDAAITTIPTDEDAWCTNPSVWPDLTNPNRTYHAASTPPPANPADNIYIDTTLIMDDEDAPALCFQNETLGQFNLHLSLYRDSAGDRQFSQLQLDMREWQRLKFRFRHPTYVSSGSTYRLILHTGGANPLGGVFFNNRYQYEFGLGTQEVDTVDSSAWTEIDLLLPEVDVDGTVIEYNGWVPYNDWDPVNAVWVLPDPTNINWVSLYVSCNELDPGNGPGQALVSNASAGDEYLRVANPEYFAGYSAVGTKKLFWNPNAYVLEDAGDSEEVRVRGVSIDSIPAPDNLELDKGIVNNYTVAAGATISTKGGWTICFSQFHFERQLRYEPPAVSPTPPYRYRMMIAKEMENLNEAISLAEGIIAQEEEAMRPVRVEIDDGDVRFEIGYSPRLYLDVDPFDAVNMFIDDAQYELGPDNDFKIILFLGEGNRRSRELTEYTVLNTHDKQLRNLGLGTSRTKIIR